MRFHALHCHLHTLVCDCVASLQIIFLHLEKHTHNYKEPVTQV